jgi:hypothetical protein
MDAGAAKPLPSMAPPLPSRQSRVRHGSRSGASVAEKCGNWLSPPAWGVATLVRISRCRSSGAPRASRSAATGAFARERGTDRRRTAIPPPHRARNRHRCAWRDRASRRGSERRSGSGGRSSRRHGPQRASGFLGRGWGAVVQVKDATVETVVGAAKVVLLGAIDRMCGPSSAAVAPKQPTAGAIAAIAPRREPTARQANTALRPGDLRRIVLGGLIAERSSRGCCESDLRGVQLTGAG